MRMRLNFLVLCTVSLTVVLISQNTFAQQVAPLTWADCVKIADQNNAAMLTARANVRALDFAKDATVSNFLPSLAAVGVYNRTKTEGTINPQNLQGGSAIGSLTNYSGGLNAKMNVFTGFGDMGKLWQAQAKEREAEANLRIAKAQVSYDLKQAFAGLVYAKEAQKLTAEIIRRRKENAGLVDLRFQGGRENKGSVLLARAYLAQASYEHLKAENAQRVARRQLSRALGYDELAEYDIAGDVPINDPNNILPNFEELALSTPDYGVIKAQEDNADAGVVMARSGFSPKLDVEARVTDTGQQFYPDDKKQSYLGITLTIPLFNGGADYFGTRSAVANRSAAQGNRHNTVRLMLAKLEATYAAFLEAVAKFSVDLTFRDATTTRAEIARKKYNNGLLTFEDWDVIESDLITRQTTYLQSKRDRVTAEASWEQVQGKGAFQ